MAQAHKGRQWVRTDWQYPWHGATLYLTKRDVLMNRQLVEEFLRCDDDPDQIAAAAERLIHKCRPELVGGQLMQIAFGGPGQISAWRFTYIHSSLPACDIGMFENEMPLIPRVEVSEEAEEAAVSGIVVVEQ